MILGLTGFSGAGKTTVAEIFKEQGFYHIDCDEIVHHKVYRDSRVLRVLADAFGEDILKNGELNRPLLRKYTMGNPDALRRLNELVMPWILKAIDADLQAHKECPIILDAPLLFESELDQKCDFVLSVVADPKVAVQRIIQRDHLMPTDAEKRLSSQHPSNYYISKSDYILWNNDNLDELRNHTLKLIQTILNQ